MTDSRVRHVTVDERRRVSLGDLVEPGQEFAAFIDQGQVILAPVITVVRTPENAETWDRIDAFVKDPSTGVRRTRPARRVQPGDVVGGSVEAAEHMRGLPDRLGAAIDDRERA